ncbi:MAG: hypothetical protein HON55_01630, partial [Legionellales bacterium]|nr:hypothetical protein [Legionellales bacterium]
SENLAATVKTTLSSAGDVENAIIKFLETNKLIVAVSPADIVAIKKEFSTNYSIIRISDHMDEFFVKPKNKDNPWFEYGGSMCVEFSEFAKGVSPDESSEFINGKIKEFKSVPRKDDNSITYAGDPSLQLINKLEDAGYPAHKLLDIMLENNITDPELFDKVISKIDPNEIDVNKTWFFVVKNNQMQLLEFLTTNNIACPIDAKIDGLQILNFAIEKGRTDIAKALIENGADVNAKDKDGLTPLNMATYFSHLDIAEFLIKKGANLNAKDKYGFTPIHLAIVQDNLELVKLFLGRDPNIINTADNYANINPLHIAVSFGHIDIAEFLINKDADVNAKDKSGSTPMHMAIIQVDKKIAKGLIKALINIEKIDLDAKDNKGYTPLHTAIERLNLGAAKAFITKGANINAKDNKGYTPLHTAIEHRNLRSVNALIEKNADVNAKDNQGYTPLHMAVFQSETVILQALITKGANINANDNQGYTPLHIAAFQSETETLQALIKVEKIDLNAKNKQGNTPLHMAAIGGHIDIVKVLLEKGAEVGIKNSQDYTALNIAHQGDNQEIIKLIETAMDSKDTPENKGMKL